MADQTLIDSIRAAAQKSLDMGFALITCEPHQKTPYAKYSPHAVNSASRIPDIVFQAWVKGEEANYAVACGQSNLSVVDVDHGIKSIEAFEAWKAEHNIPETFTVLSGRDGEELGFHLYYSGAVPTTKFDIGGVTGEIKSKGGYVVGPGSIHPSGKPYTIYKDVPVVPLPEGIRQLAPAEKQWEAPVAQGGKLVAKGGRWASCQSKTGTFRNAGLDEEGIYHALVNYVINNCEDGEQYATENDQKLRNLAKAGINKFDAMEPAPIVLCGDGDKKPDATIPELPQEVIAGDWIGELTELLTTGTFIPPAFVRNHIKTVLGITLDGMVSMAKHSSLHMRQWAINIGKPQSGKGESWVRVGRMALANYISKIQDLHIIEGESLGSGEYMVIRLQEEGLDNQRVILYYDELSNLLIKGLSQNSTLLPRLCQVYESKKCSTGSIKNGGNELNNISLAFCGGIPPSEWENMSGKGAGGSGFLSRCVLAHTQKPKTYDDWPDLDTVSINAVAAKMFQRWQEIRTAWSEQNDYTKHPKNKENGWRWVVEETPEAHELRTAFGKFLQQKALQYQQEDVQDYTERIDDHFKRDVVLRTIFSDDGILTAEKMEKSIQWAKHELMLREELWPIDKGNLAARMEANLTRAFRKQGALTKREAIRFCNALRPETGGLGVFNQVWKNMLQAEWIIKVGVTTKHTDKFDLRENS